MVSPCAEAESDPKSRAKNTHCPNGLEGRFLHGEEILPGQREGKGRESGSFRHSGELIGHRAFRKFVLPINDMKSFCFPFDRGLRAVLRRRLT